MLFACHWGHCRGRNQYETIWNIMKQYETIWNMRKQLFLSKSWADALTSTRLMLIASVASRIRAAKQCVKLRFFDEQCQMYINETSVLPRYKRQFLNRFLKSCNHFIKTLLTILNKTIHEPDAPATPLFLFRPTYLHRYMHEYWAHLYAPFKAQEVYRVTL